MHIILNHIILLWMNFQFEFVHSASTKNIDGVTFQFPWRCIKRLKMNWTTENNMERQLVRWDCQFILDLIYRVHGKTSQPWDCPTPIEFMGTHLIHGIAQLLWAWTHNSSTSLSKLDWFAGIHLTNEIVHNWMKFLFNIMNDLSSWYCLLWTYNTNIY